jgi:cytochrome c oxidase subunit 2
MALYIWSTAGYLVNKRVPVGAMDIYVIGKQWMWKIQHPEGVREINELHVPIGRNVRLTIGSEDVIHDFSLPSFRVKMDAVPGKFTTLWFKATQLGAYHIFCMQYCGTKHAGMVGTVYVMSPGDYEAWLAGGRTTGTPVANGEQLFTELQCITCHKADSTGKGPSLVGVPGSTVQLADGRSVVADDNYLRESIVNSQAKVVQGYQPLMPTFQGQISEENLLQLIAYIKSLKKDVGGQGARGQGDK